MNFEWAKNRKRFALATMDLLLHVQCVVIFYRQTNTKFILFCQISQVYLHFKFPQRYNNNKREKATKRFDFWWFDFMRFSINHLETTDSGVWLALKMYTLQRLKYIWLHIACSVYVYIYEWIKVPFGIELRIDLIIFQ